MIVALFGLLMPRFIMVLLWLFSDYLTMPTARGCGR